jgi:hypothetical protein
MMILLALAAAVQNPNGMSNGLALKSCAVRAAYRFDDHVSAPSIIAHRAVFSCTSELSATRAALRTIVSRYANPDTAGGQKAVATHLGIITQAFEKELATEIQSTRRGSH